MNLETRVNDFMQDVGSNFDPKSFVQQPQVSRNDFKKYENYINSANFPSLLFDLDSGTKTEIAAKKFMDFFSRKHKKYHRASEFVEDKDGKKKEAYQFLDNSLNTLKDFSHFYRQAYNQTEERLKSIPKEKEKLEEDKNKLVQDYQNQIEQNNQKIENPSDWKDYITGTFGLGRAWFGKNFTNINYNINLKSLKKEEKSLKGRQKSVYKNLQKTLNHYNEAARLKENLEDADRNAISYVAKKKTPYKNDRNTVKKIGDFFGF